MAAVLTVEDLKTYFKTESGVVKAVGFREVWLLSTFFLV
jgi:hypothetical protein